MKLKETNPNPFEDGIFFRLSTLVDFIELEDSHLLDVEYYLNRSGEKEVSPLVESLINLQLTDYLTKLANIISNHFKDNWERIHQAYLRDYNPVENYSMIEEENIGSEISVERDVTNDTFGFNSTSSVPTSSSKELTTSRGDKETNERVLTRKGNIGVTTTQQMLESEIKLREFDLIKRMMEDVDRILTLSIYKG